MLHFNYVRVGEQIDEQSSSKQLKKNTSTYYIRGIDENFANHGGLPLIAWDESLATSEKEIWQLVSENDIFVIVDSAFAMTYGVDENGLLNYEEIRALAKVSQPNVIVAGASAYPRQIDWAAFKDIAL